MAEELPNLGRVKMHLACQKKSTAQRTINLNTFITDPLKELIELYDFLKTGHEYKKKAHLAVVAALGQLDFKVTDIAQLCGHQLLDGQPLVPCFSKDCSSRRKVLEILGKGRIEKLDELKKCPKTMGIVDLAKVWGVGASKAQSLWHQGFKGFEDLRAAVAKQAGLAAAGSPNAGPPLLSPQQLIGLRHHADFQTRMPRAEAKAIGAHVAAAAQAACPGCSVDLAGSYRRGKADCGDLDVLIAPPPEYMSWSPKERAAKGAVRSIEFVLPAVLRTLHASGVVTDDLTRGEGRSYMGVARLPAGSVEGDEDEDEGNGGDCSGGEGGDGSGGGGGEGGGDGELVVAEAGAGVHPSSLALVCPASTRIHRRLDIKVNTTLKS